MMKQAKPHPESDFDSNQKPAAATMVNALLKASAGEFGGCCAHCAAQCKANTKLSAPPVTDFCDIYTLLECMSHHAMPHKSKTLADILNLPTYK